MAFFIFTGIYVCYIHFPFYTDRYGYVLKVTCFWMLDQLRTRLNGMLIHGGLIKDGVFTQLYQDTSNVKFCSAYRDYGDNVCDDVILIPITSQQKVRFFKISANSYLTVCELQVFAGECIAYCKIFHRAKQLSIKELIDNRCHVLKGVPERRAIHKLNAIFSYRKLMSEYKYSNVFK